MFQYPDTELTPDWLRQFNWQVQTNGFNKGRFGLALDVWRDNVHLFRNYDLGTSESFDEWCFRNYPDVPNPEYRLTGMGVPLVTGQDQYPVPTRASCGGHYSLTAIRSILRAALATAQYPFPPEVKDVPKANAIRQRMIGDDLDWHRINVVDLESQVAIRAIVLNKGQASEPVQWARYGAKLVRREGSTMESKLNIGYQEFTAPVADLSTTQTRRPILKAAKETMDMIGLHGRITHAAPDQTVFTLSSEPFDLHMHLIDVQPTTPTPELEGTLDL